VARARWVKLAVLCANRHHHIALKDKRKLGYMYREHNLRRG
jgi:hypothetical protein